jgi:hypothetical protein
MKCQYADRTVRPYSSWVSTAVVLLTAFMSELESTQAFAPDAASSVHNGLEHQQKQQQQRPSRSSLPPPYTFSDELSSSSSSRRNGGISTSLDVRSISLPSSPISIYTDGSVSPTSQMLQELERSFSLGSNHADLTNFPSHSRAVATGSKRNRLSKMIRPKSLSSSPRLEGGTGATQNAPATVSGSSSLLTREEEGNLVSNIRRMRKVVRVRDELIAHLAAASTGTHQQQQNQDVSESEWARACGLAPKQLRRVMYDGQEARSVVVSANAGLVTSIAKRQYQALKQAMAYGGGVGTILTLHDMIQEGNLGIMEAAERFEPERGLRFSTYATYWIRQRILRSISDSSRIIRLPAYGKRPFRMKFFVRVEKPGRKTVSLVPLQSGM